MSTRLVLYADFVVLIVDRSDDTIDSPHPRTILKDPLLINDGRLLPIPRILLYNVLPPSLSVPKSPLLTYLQTFLGAFQLFERANTQERWNRAQHIQKVCLLVAGFSGYHYCTNLVILQPYRPFRFLHQTLSDEFSSLLWTDGADRDIITLSDVFSCEKVVLRALFVPLYHPVEQDLRERISLAIAKITVISPVHAKYTHTKAVDNSLIVSEFSVPYIPCWFALCIPRKRAVHPLETLVRNPFYSIPHSEILATSSTHPLFPPSFQPLKFSSPGHMTPPVTVPDPPVITDSPPSTTVLPNSRAVIPIPTPPPGPESDSPVVCVAALASCVPWLDIRDAFVNAKFGADQKLILFVLMMVTVAANIVLHQAIHNFVFRVCWKVMGWRHF